MIFKVYMKAILIDYNICREAELTSDMVSLKNFASVSPVEISNQISTQISHRFDLKAIFYRQPQPTSHGGEDSSVRAWRFVRLSDWNTSLHQISSKCSWSWWSFIVQERREVYEYFVSNPGLTEKRAQFALVSKTHPGSKAILHSLPKVAFLVQNNTTIYINQNHTS